MFLNDLSLFFPLPLASRCRLSPWLAGVTEDEDIDRSFPH